MNDNSNFIYRLLKSMRAHIQAKIILMKVNNRICSTHKLDLILSDPSHSWCRKGVNQ